LAPHRQRAVAPLRRFCLPRAGVNVFSYDPTIGEFLLTRQNVKIPEKPQKVRGARARARERESHGLAMVCATSPLPLSLNAIRCRLLPPCVHPAQIYSFNEGNYAAFPAGVRKFIDFCKAGDKPYSLRYVGSMVADVSIDCSARQHCAALPG
jgi:hypothetical protein